MDTEKIQDRIKELLIAVGTDPNQEGLRETPRRVSESLVKLLEGYTRSFSAEITVF